MFVTFEGIEGSGKSSVMALMAENLARNGHEILVTREPGGSGLGRMLRSILLDARSGDLSPAAELHLFMADRAQHVAEVIRPALDNGNVVLCDRYTDSTIAYQGYGRGMNLEDLAQLNRLAADGLNPDLTILLDLPVSVGLTRAGNRNREQGTIISEGRFDAESHNFHERVRQGYLAMAARDPERIIVIDADRDLESILSDCLLAFQSQYKAHTIN